MAEWAGKATLEACLNVLVLSLSLVMAGTGDLQVLRLCRHLRMRAGSFSNVVTYGSHVATHMALGFLHLGGGRLTLATSAEAIAALICACYPKFPTHSNDNRYHLQALRHLHVLATEPRLLVPTELPNMQACYTNVEVTFVNQMSFNMRAPCLLPELKFLKRIKVMDPRYRSIVFDRHHNWQKLVNILLGKDSLIVQRKAGCLSYTEDPTGLASLATPSLSAWAIRASTVAHFTTDKFVLYLCRQFLSSDAVEMKSVPLDVHLRKLSLILNDCVVNEKTELIKPWLQLIQQSTMFRSTLPVWQLKFLIHFASSGAAIDKFIDSEMMLALRHQLESEFDNQMVHLRSSVRTYLSRKDTPFNRSHAEELAQLAVFYDLPFPSDLLDNVTEDPMSLLKQLQCNVGEVGLDQKLAARLMILLFL